MALANLLVLMVSGMLLGVAVRNLLGRPSLIGIRSGWVAMVGFAALAAWCFWRAREFRGNPAAAAAVVAAQKFMVLYLVGLLLSAYGVGVQRRKLRQAAAPPPPGTPSPPDLS